MPIIVQAPISSTLSASYGGHRVLIRGVRVTMPRSLKPQESGGCLQRRPRLREGFGRGIVEFLKIRGPLLLSGTIRPFLGGLRFRLGWWWDAEVRLRFFSGIRT